MGRLKSIRTGKFSSRKEQRKISSEAQFFFSFRDGVSTGWKVLLKKFCSNLHSDAKVQMGYSVALYREWSTSGTRPRYQRGYNYLGFLLASGILAGIPHWHQIHIFMHHYILHGLKGIFFPFLNQTTVSLRF
uniref:Uncharacterized protein n=1 Tax=Rousettus aegyptiacus TaxID=9407 RepID=A0A7J8DXM4_ROUAE|nr:hypothetical protein HJG63_008376 [Rousettus aegyptiacus]